MANAATIYVGGLHVTFRMPWHPAAAYQQGWDAHFRQSYAEQERLKDERDELKTEVEDLAAAKDRTFKAPVAAQDNASEFYRECARLRKQLDQMIAGKVADDERHSRAIAAISERQMRELESQRAENAELRNELQNVLNSARPSEKEQPTMHLAWTSARGALAKHAPEQPAEGGAA